MESKILEEASRLIEEMQAQNGQAFDTAVIEFCEDIKP